jgi:hypothetical protein
MKKRATQLLNIMCGVIILLITTTCTKENFNEPPDPFAPQKLETDPRVFQLGEGSDAIILKTNHDNVENIDGGVRLKGSLFVENGTYGDIRLTNGDVELLLKDGSTDVYEKFDSYCLFKLPSEGVFNGLELLNFPSGNMFYKKGSEFETGAFEWPVNTNRYYFYYENPDPLEGAIYSGTFSKLNKVAIDPKDPFVYFSCNLEGTPLGFIEEAGVAMSAQGLIPFEPAVTSYKIPYFEGHLYISASIPLKKFPVTIQGETVLAFDKNDESSSSDFFENKNSAFTMGLNGRALFTPEQLDWLPFDLELGRTSLFLNVEKSGSTTLMFVGERQSPPKTPGEFINDIVGQDWEFMKYLNFGTQSKETIYGTLGTNHSDWEIGFKHESHLAVGGFNIKMAELDLEVSPEHLYFLAEVRVGPISDVGVSGEVERNGNFKFTGSAHTGFKIGSDGNFSLYLSFDMGVDVLLEHVNSVVTFEGDIYFEGKACVNIKGLPDPCISASFGVGVSIKSSGEIRVCFKIGIGDFGFNVCRTMGGKYDLQKGTAYEETIVTSIPIEDVPIENRFPIEYFNYDND